MKSDRTIINCILFPGILCSLSLLAFVSEVRGQFLEAPFIWEISHVDTTADFYYCFTAISCSGNNCTAALLLHDRSQAFGFPMKFARTTDGGDSWVIQDPHLPDQCCQNNNMLRHTQQIDSLNIVAIGDTGLIIRTFDGGITWERQDCHTLANLSGVHFFDSLIGIAVARSASAVDRIVTTTDGGRNWSKVTTFNALYAISCHCFGLGKYSVLQQHGPLYFTDDNWKTIRTVPIIDSSVDSTWNAYDFRDVRFAGKDTIIAYGSYNFGGSYSVITRSIDGGLHWETPFTTISLGNTFMSEIRDTILAGGINGFYWIQVSTDRGYSWKQDSLLISTGGKNLPQAFTCWGMDWTKDHPIAIYSGPPMQGGQSIIFRGRNINSVVETDGRIYYHQRVFPNPVRSILNIASIVEPSPYKIQDVFGRIVMQGMVLDRATLTLDVSSLPGGVYFVFVDDLRDHHPVLVGKVMILGK